MTTPTLIGSGTSVAGWITVLLAVPTLWIGLSMLVKGLRSRHWPTYKGWIVSSRVDVQVKNNTGKKIYQAEVVYEFDDQNDATQRANRTSCGFQGYGPQQVAESLVESFPASQPVDVYYDPKDPTFTVLRPGVATSSVFVTVIGAAFLLIGVLILTDVIGAS